MPSLWAARVLALLVPCAAGSTPEQAAKGSRLRIVNGCGREPLWVAHEAGQGVGPDPQNVKVEPLAFHDFATPGGLFGTRYWPKMRCDEQGNACDIGESGGPQEVCGTKAGCAPPVDTKFEATFGHEGEEDWVDMSLVDGYTLPFRFEMKGNCSAGFGERRDGGSVVDCSHLSVEDCPSGEDLGDGRRGVSLKVVNPDTNKVVGCYSPCSKLTLAQWGNRVVGDQDLTAPYCCPTPPESPEACRAGPVGSTRFVEAVHRMCPGVYAYSYDDGMGLVRCPSHTRYEVTFYCPAAPSAPSSLRRSPSSPQPPAPAAPPAPAPQSAPPAPAPPQLEASTIGDATWVRVLGLPQQEGETMHVAGPVTRAAHADDVRRVCLEQALCVGFSFRPKTGEWYLKRLGTGFDASTASWLRYKWGHEEWQFHYIRERSKSGPIHWARHPAKCLGVTGASKSNGHVQLQECIVGSSPQQFIHDSFGRVHWAANPSLCFDVFGRLPISGNRLRLAVCERADEFQAFEFPASGSGQIRWKEHRSMCLDVQGSGAADGTPIQIWECSDGDSSQDFTHATSAANRGAGIAAAAPPHKARAEARQIRWASHPRRCLTPVEGDVTSLRLEDCGGSGTEKQRFVWEGTEGKIQSAERPDLCIAIVNHEPHVRLSQCATLSATLQFKGLGSRAGAKIRWGEFPEFCLDAAEGRDIQLRVCADGGGKQDFTTLGGGASHHGEAGGMDLLSGAVADGSRATLPTWAVSGTSPQKSPTDGGGDEPADSSSRMRLLIRNGCEDEQMWIARRATSGEHPEMVKLQPQESRRFATPSGTAGSTFWPKLGCGADGRSCRIGDRVAGDCGPQGCTPVDTVFEAIFGTNGGDLAFISLDKGFTLPFTLEVKGDCQKGSSTLPAQRIDCSGLSLSRCPIAEDLGVAGSGVDLRFWNARQEVAGCFSPCTRAQHVHGKAQKNLTREYCCSPATSGSSCRAGSTDYAEAVQQMCPDAVDHTSDRGMGVLRCHDTARYELTFYCPARGAERGHQLVEMLVSKSSEQTPAIGWRWRCQWLAGIAGAVAVGAAALMAARASSSWRRHRGHVLWQPLATLPGV